MKRKLMKRYIFISLPFICGLLLYVIGLYGIVSSLLFFVGGYILVKNIFDYRVVKKNILKCIDDDKKMKIDNVNSDIIDGIVLDLDRDKINSDIIDEDRGKIVNDVSIDNGLFIEDAVFEQSDDNVMNNLYEYVKRDNINGLKRVRIYKKVRRRY